MLVCSDEAYTELWFDEPPASALQVGDRRNVVVFNTLSKRSSMTGYRCGFVAGDEDVIEALRKFRPNVGTAPQEFVQRASIAAWGDEEHVERTARATPKRALFLELFERKGLASPASGATMYLWVESPDGETSESFAERLLEHGVVVAPGSYFGPAGEGYVRLALVPTEEECARRGRVLEEVSERSSARSTRSGTPDPSRAGAVEETIAALDRGELRVAEKHGDGGSSTSG